MRYCERSNIARPQMTIDLYRFWFILCPGRTCECLKMHDTQVPIHTYNNIRYIFVSDSARCLWRWRQRACPVSACTHTHVTYRTYTGFTQTSHTHTHLYYIHLNHAVYARGTTTSAAAAASAGASICKQWLVRLQQASVKFIRRF